MCYFTKIAAYQTGGSGSRMAAPLAKATGVNFAEDLMPPQYGSTPSLRGGSAVPKTSPTPMMLKRSLSPLDIP